MQQIHSAFLKMAFTVNMLFWAIIAVTPAEAAPLSFYFEGTVSSVDAALLSPTSPFGNVGSPYNGQLSGNFTYDSALLSSSLISGDTGLYNGVITNPSVTIGTYQASLSGNSGSFVQIRDQVPFSIPGHPGPFYYDEYLIQAPIVNLNAVNAATPIYFEITFIHAPSVFGNTALVPPTLGNLLGTPSFRLVFQQGTGSPQITGSVPTFVPLPPAVILFGAGLVALIGLGARNWQRTRVVSS